MFAHIGTLLLTFAVAIVLIVQTGYSTHANIVISGVKDAKSLITTSTSLGWIGAVISVIYFAGVILFPEEMFSPAFKWVTIGTFLLINLDKFVIGILLAVAARKIKSSSNYEQNKEAYSLVTTGSYIGIISSCLIAIIYLGIIFYHHHPSSHSKSSPVSLHSTTGLHSSSGLSSILTPENISTGLKIADLAL